MVPRQFSEFLNRQSQFDSGRGLQTQTLLATSVGGAIVTSLAARRAVVKAILTEADVNLALAKAAVFFAAAFVFGSFALHTHVFLAGTSA